MSNIITRVKAAQGLKFPPNQEVTMNADGSGGPVSINKDAKFMTTMYGGKSGGTTEKHKEIEKSDTGGSWYDKFSDYGHVALDGLGMVPAFGAIADGINAAWYAGEGLTGIGPNSREESAMYAAMSAAAMVPGAGQGVTATKYATKGYDKLNKFGKFKNLINPNELVKNVKMDVSDVVKNKSLKGFKVNPLDVLVGSSSVANSAYDISNQDYDKPKVQEEISALESERRGDEAINDPMSSGKTKSWSKGYSDYKSGGGKGSLSDFKNEANSWWNSAAGQKYAKDKNIKHRIASPSKQRYMGGVASSNRQSLKYYKQ